ncbi:Do family serine endopeptidase [Rufibacter glacialis]|uniref:Do family serine endopeptidase n=1 Tax=Rufibacter glacialis TaxID=1259555 RepID=A0A5M8QPZ6_9BACT|nr:Do family serine endopeptidase [Rufibacter glacialis]KAA6437348.1 Do family serine endopeptidase [Rufibacter glacialis]
MRTKQFMLGLLLSAMMGGGVAVGGYKLLEDDAPAAGQQSPNTNVRYTSAMRSSDVVVPEGLNFVTSAELVTPAVVHVTTEYKVQARRSPSASEIHPFFRDFFGDEFEGYQRQQGPAMGSGSGVIIASNGYVVTNNHVIDRADKIQVILDDKRTYDATLVGTDPNTDIALLKINADNLPALRYGNSDKVRVGEWVLAVGNPFNLNSTVTAGIVSAKGRNVGILQGAGNMSVESFIQTDAAVNPGNSGGALVNLNGDLIGINTAIASQTGSFAGYSFAVPSSIVSKVVDDLIKFGEVQRALLGVQMQEVNADLAKEKNLKTLNGVYVAGFSESSAAKTAGLQEGDVITEINGVKVNTSAQLQEQVTRYRPGDKIKVNFMRGGSEKNINVTLRNANGSTELVKRDPNSAKSMTIDGAKFEAASKQELNKLELTGGVKITGVEKSAFAETGMKDGFIITSIDKTPTNAPQDVDKVLKSTRRGGLLIEGVYPDGRRAYYAMGR